MYRSFVYRLILPYDLGTAYLCRNRHETLIYVLTPEGDRIGLDEYDSMFSGSTQIPDLTEAFIAHLYNGAKPIAQFIDPNGAFKYAPYKRGHFVSVSGDQKFPAPSEDFNDPTDPELPPPDGISPNGQFVTDNGIVYADGEFFPRGYRTRYTNRK